MTARAEIVTAARGWLRVQFHHQGYGKAGCDCIGLIAGVALELGIDGARQWLADPRFHSYSPQPDPRLLLEGCDQFLDQIPRGEAKPADIFLLRWENDPMHFALVSVIAPLRVIHALASLGRVVEAGPPSGAYVMRAYRFRGID